MTIYIRDRLILSPENDAGASNPEAAAQKEGLPAWVLPSGLEQKTQAQKISSQSRMFNIIAVRSHGEHPKESGKNIFALSIQATDST